MKISLAWIFDHIDADWKKQDVDKIFSKFNQVTAEIESLKKIKINLKNLFIGSVLSSHNDTMTVSIPELNEEIELELRKDLGKHFLVYKDKDNKSYRWAKCKDVSLEKEGFLPAFDVEQKDLKGNWRKLFESEDIILDVDNKSLTHRPDMWGHRGFAREVAAFIGLPFIPKKDFLNTNLSQGDDSPFTIEIEAHKACFRFAGLYFKSIENKQSNIFIASRLIKAGVRPINAIVDLTNYVMLDWSQPVHAYDAKKIKDQKLVARMAKGGEKLTLLDGQELELTKQDLIIADGKNPVGLAGVMGGLNGSISENTDSIFFESANFEASHIRRTSIRYGIRTDSSTRFEKTLDPNQIEDAILRFVALCDKFGIKAETAKNVVSFGRPFEEKTIGVTHSFLERRSGVAFEKTDIIDVLEKIGFVVKSSQEVVGDLHDTLYTITIPSFRGAKDVQIKEDILEEVVRFFGFNKIALTLPELKKEPSDMIAFFRERKIKDYLSSCARMTEQRNYLYYDEEFLKETNLDFKDSVSITNPVSQNNSRLATCLLPNLFKNIKDNSVNENSLRFFEVGQTVRLVEDNILEEKKLAGIFFEKRKDIDFYQSKQFVTDLLEICDLGSKNVKWKKIDKDIKEYPWIALYQSAEIFFQNRKIGIAGKVDKSFLSKIDALPESEAFFFDINLELILEHKKDDMFYSPISKFQEVTFDLCFMIPLTLTVSEIESVLFDSDDFIKKVQLIDFFDKKDWVDKRSVAFRLWVSHPEKTLEKEDIESVRQNALKQADKLGVELRG